MSSSATEISDLIGREYKEGFVTEIEADTLPPGLDEGVIRQLSAKKNEPEFMLDWRLDAFRRWQDARSPRTSRAKPSFLSTASRRSLGALDNPLSVPRETQTPGCNACELHHVALV